MKKELEKIYLEIGVLRDALQLFGAKLKKSDEKHRRSLKERRELKKYIVELRHANEVSYIRNLELVKEKQKIWHQK